MGELSEFQHINHALGETPCASPQHRISVERPTCVWLGEPPPRSPNKVPPNDDAEILSFREALVLLKISRNTLYRLVHTGQIPGVRRVGRAWRFHRASLMRWLSCPDSERRGRRRRR